SSTPDEPSTDASTANQPTTDTSETNGATDTGAADSTSSSAAGGITINPQSSGASSTAGADSMTNQSPSSTDTGSNPSSSSGSNSSASTSSSSGLSPGAVAGVAVAVVIVAAAIVGGLVLFMRRRSDAKAAAASATFPRGLDWSADAAAGNRSGTPPGGSRSRSDSSSALLERGLGDGTMSQISGGSSNMLPINAGQAPHTVALAGAGGARAGVVPAAVAMPPPAASYQSPDSPVPDVAAYATAAATQIPTGQSALDRQLSVASSTEAASSVIVAAPSGPSPHRSASGRANAPDTASIQLPAEPIA
ncbi:hypothetical protein HK405_010362, partial [Cladochytrium tenue]